MLFEALELAHRHSAHHREAIEKSILCGCFFCIRTFLPIEITDWVDDDDTALCPYCGIDAVLGSECGYFIDDDFLQRMQARWFPGEA